MNDTGLRRIENYLRLLESMICTATVDLTDVQIVDPAQARYDCPPDDADWGDISSDRRWGRQNGWMYLRGRGKVPGPWRDSAVDLVVRCQSIYHSSLPMGMTGAAGPEGQVFIDGRRTGAIDSQHHTVRHAFEGGGQYDVRAVFFAGQLPCGHVLENFRLVRIDVPAEKLYNDMHVLLEVVRQLPLDSIDRQERVGVLEATIRTIDFRDISHVEAPALCLDSLKYERFCESVQLAQKTFDDLLHDTSPCAGAPSVVAVGHGHIDLAWLWPISQTHHKCVRTFATQCRLLDQYDRWVYNQSSPQAYCWVEHDAPALFAQIREHVRAGRWEADGAMWCEADTNVTGGESLVRQFLYGKTYFKDKFNVDSRMLWLPDVFGYSACLPQLMKLAGVDAFVTSKISWNEFNRFPYDTFRWRGLDGTEIPTHFIGTPLPRAVRLDEQVNANLRTYNALMNVAEIKDCWDVYRQKNTGIDPLLTFGYGDGGGGPTEKMLQVALRMADMPMPTGVPRIKLEPTGQLLSRVLSSADKLPVWDGELYLEFHRGTYTSQAWLKRANRKNEIRLHNLEWLASLAGGVATADKQTLDSIWQDLLLCQFHDILPGSSIGPVYDEVRDIQESIKNRADAVVDDLLDALCRRIDTSDCAEPIIVFNTLSWERNEAIQLPDGTWRDDVNIPSAGWAVIDAGVKPENSGPGELYVSKDVRELHNRFWKLRLDDQGQITELYDRLNRRQVLQEGAVANEWQLFEDRPLQTGNDAWDISLHYEDYPLPKPKLQSIRVVETGPVRIAVELVWHLRESAGDTDGRITQRLVLYASDPRIDFETEIEWHEHHQLLKVAFPVDIRATEATYQVQFGHLRRPTHRNTSWDSARFEVCAQQFVDIAEHGYGVALLNDCRYGHDVHDGVLRLTCIKSAQFPDENADQGLHKFTYSLLPHSGTFQDADVTRAAAQLNTPLIVRQSERLTGDLSSECAFVRCDNNAVVVETIKPAEDGRGLIARCYESHGSHGCVTLTFAREFAQVGEVSLLEEPIDTGICLAHDKETVKFNVRPFQIVTLRLA